VVPIIFRPITYSNDTETATMRGKNITVENLSPILTDEEVSEQRQAIEEGLFDIFEKYQSGQQM